MIANGEADVLLWVQSFNVNAAPPVADIPTIVIGRSGMQFEKQPDVFHTGGYARYRPCRSCLPHRQRRRNPLKKIA